ncbi:MAG: GHMP kinase [Chloroflexi bacterium]|nr:GHMP kinase [Chloroflexota bacterium]
MIITRTPLRISFAGGGSDLPAFYLEEPGAVTSTAINKYIYITVNRKFDHQIRASYSVTEMVEAVDDLRHELIRESLRLLMIDGGIEITSISDIPSQGTGLGSSSSYTVGLLNALHAYYGQHADADRLAQEACHVELERCGKPIGKQDQYIAAFGGIEYIRFYPDGSVFVEPIICQRQTRQILQQHLLMLYTGLSRSADTILAEQSRNTRTSQNKRQTLRQMVQMASDLRNALIANDLQAFGEILHAAWMLKRQLASGITSDVIDTWYCTARTHGAIGGKILGAGGGGFLLLYAPPERHAEITAALPGLRRIPFRFEPQGSRIIYVEESSDV